MGYHIDTAIIKDKFKENCFCPLCQIKKVVEEQLLYEFLNDAVMEDDTRIKVGKLGFCKEHFDKLFSRQNKLSLALQEQTYTQNLLPLLESSKSTGKAKKTADKILHSVKTCIICELTEESMIKYYKTVGQLFLKEKEFRPLLISSKGFCLEHYSMLLKYSDQAGYLKKEYLDVLSDVEKKAFSDNREILQVFCNKHDYRNALTPLGNAEKALPNLRELLFGLKDE